MIKLYSKPGCSFCVKAKLLLELKQLEFTEEVLDIGQKDLEPDKTYLLLSEFKATYPTVRTLPYILIDNIPVGGNGTYTELYKHLT